MNATRLNVPLMILAPLLAAVAGAGGSWAVTKAQVDTTTAQVQELREEAKGTQQEKLETQLRFQKLEIEMAEVAHSLSRIERKLGTGQ